MTFDSSLRDAAHRLGRKRGFERVPSELRSKILSNLPEVSPQAVSRSRPIAPTVIGGYVIVSALTVALISRLTRAPLRLNPETPVVNKSTSFSQPPDPTLPLQDKVRVAVLHANTWHMIGKEYGNTRDDSFTTSGSTLKPQSRWECWGQRDPPIYREEYGNETLIVAGGKRTCILPGRVIIEPSGVEPPLPTRLGGSAGIEGLLKTSSPKISLPPGAFAGLPTASYAVDTGTSGKTEVLRKKTVYSISNGQRTVAEGLTIDSKTSLPERYTNVEDLNNGQPGSPIHTGNVIEAQFNQPIPKDIAKFTPPSGAITIDVRGTGKPASSSTSEQATIQGLTATLEVTSVDADGDVFYATRWRFSGKPINARMFTYDLLLSVGDLKLTDDRGTRYLCIGGLGPNSGGNAAVAVPIEPRAPHAALPTRLNAEFSVEFSGLTGTRSMTSGIKYKMPMVATATLSRKSEHEVRATSPRLLAEDAKLSLAILEARSSYYLMGADQPRPTNGAASSKVGDNLAGQTANRPGTPIAAAPMSIENLPPVLTAENYEHAVHWTKAVIDEATREGKNGVARQYRWRLQSLGVHP